MNEQLGGFLQQTNLLLADAAATCDRRLSVCPETSMGLPRDISVDGWHIDLLLKFTTYAISILFAIMVVWMLYSCLFHNKKNQAKYDLGESKKNWIFTLSIAAIIFLIIDGTLFVSALQNLGNISWNFSSLEEKSSEEVVRVEVNAHQWAWDFRYAGPDGEFATEDDIVVLNELRVPAGVPIWIQLTSTDVVHALNFPNLRTKFDAVPGTINQIRFTVREHTNEDPTLGRYDIACAQHCGVNHYKMKGQLIVLSKEEFASWLALAAQNNKASGLNANDSGAQWGWPWRGPW
jgi:cytochrome c oxidase subunit 2